MLCGLMFLSGASAVIFESLWFRQASLTFGNSVWATTLVLVSFMGGLALGNAITGRLGHRVRRPIRAYAGLEVAIGVTGVGLVVLLPALSALLVPVFRPLLDTPWLLNPVRLLLALALMLVPATAMGATLPFLTQALTAADPSFGRALGRLYGWNTLGAVAGALAAEWVLVGAFGVVGAGLFAAGLNLVAAAGARVLPAAQVPIDVPDPTPTRGGRRLLAAAFVSGAALLALEVVWFRFLLLFVVNTNQALAVLLAVVLLGIGLGGLAGSALLARGLAPRTVAAVTALVAGVLVVTCYGVVSSERLLTGVGLTVAASKIALLGVCLMLPIAFASGILFTVLGAATAEQLKPASRAAGLLTFANTSGAMLGAVAGGFVLLPRIGLEGSFFVLALAYGVVAVCAVSVPAPGAPRTVFRATVALGALFAVRLAAFPFGLMEERFLPFPARAYQADGSQIVAVREGLTETVLFVEKTWLGKPVYQRMLTNGFSMSGTHTFAKRYMKLFVHFGIAFNPDAKRALLISYGVGSTAKALTDTAGLTAIDVVDISRDVLDMAAVVFPEPADQPLNDPRVKVHIEDGRYFLLTTDQRYDLITAEPPPPKNAGIVNLYTREYFALLRERLNEGGLVTYWLPVADLLEPDTKAIIAAFCEAFDDCTLWSGSALDWMLVGSRNGRPPTPEQLAVQWSDARVGPELRALGFERPEQLAATFIADHAQLRAITAGTLPLVDNYPHRIGRDADAQATRNAFAFHLPLMDAAPSRERFKASAWAQRMWPEALRAPALAAFDTQDLVNARLLPGNLNRRFVLDPSKLHWLLTTTPHRTLALWLMGSTAVEEQIARSTEATSPADRGRALTLAIAAMADRDFAGAASRLEALGLDPRGDDRIPAFRAYALCRLGRTGDAAAVRRDWLAARGTAVDAAFWTWLGSEFNLPP